MWTVWQFKSIDGRQVARKIQPARPDDYAYQHEFQIILYRGDDYNKARGYL